MTQIQTQVTEAVKQSDTGDPRNPDFVVFTDALKAHDDGDRPTVLATASSTAVDLEADRFTTNALKQMKAGFAGKLIFLNHRYGIPQDVFGVVQDVELVKREGRLDLDMVIGVEMGNPLAVQTYNYIVNGTRLGVSVGVIVTEAEKSDDEDQYGNAIFDIDGVIPLEASVVGIPANQTAWTRQAMKSLVARGALDLDTDEIEARPWLKTVVSRVKEAAGAPVTETKNKETRLWATTDDGETVVEIIGEEKEKMMAENKNDETSSEDDDKDDTDADDSDTDSKDADDSDTDSKDADDSDTDSKDADDSDTDSKDADKSDADKSEEEEKADADKSDADKSEEEEKADTKEPDETKDAFGDDIAADEAADMLVNKMYTGIYVALRNLIKIVLNTDISASDRAKEGDEIIESWSKFVTETWSEIIEHIDDSKDIDPDKDFNLDARLHTLIAAQDGVECDIKDFEGVATKVSEIGDAGEAIAADNTELREQNEKLAQAIKYMEQVMEALMELPLQTVTTREVEVAQSLAQNYPALDTRVVQRMARFAHPVPQEKE